MTNERKYEEQRLAEVVEVIEGTLEGMSGKTAHLKKDVVSIRKDFWEDVTVNVDQPDDMIETMASIKQQSEMLAERERTHGLLYKQAKALTRLKESPYFGRIDFLEDGEKAPETVYLGTASLMDANEEEFLIYDWRAPISSMYYDFSPGRASYMTMDGIIEGELELKRQFIIRHGKMTGMFDTGTTIGDDLLKEVLGNAASNQMKSIVATIQKEQNAIIRNDKDRYLIVQGVAGSGKTSVALQRVAFLLYKHLNELEADHILLFSPNPLFNSYVSSVLPDLGEENMQQTTYQEFVERIVGKEFKLEDPFSGMEYALTQKKDPYYPSRMEAIYYKSGLDFKNDIDAYASRLLNEGMLFKSISFRGETIISAQAIKNYFYSLDGIASIPNRIEAVKKWLFLQLNQQEKLEIEKDWVMDEIELLDKEDYTEVYRDLTAEQDKDTDDMYDYDRERMKLAEKVVSSHFKKLKKAIKLLKFIQIKALYLQLLTEAGHRGINDSSWSQAVSRSAGEIKRKVLPYEDVTGFIYLKDLLEGKKVYTSIRHLFVDEAQDYTPFQLELFRRMFPYSKMTILGDYNQAIYAHSMNNATLLSTDLYHEGSYEKITLTKSYRSTMPIVDFTKHLVFGGEEIEPFNREGKKPVVVQLPKDGERDQIVLNRIRHFIDCNYQTIAVICKTEEESRIAYENLKQMEGVQLMTRSTYSFKKGILILPAYLAKGIEFDAVIIYDASDSAYNDELERNLFYTACTRAMHELYLVAAGEATRFLSGVPDVAYIIEKTDGTFDGQ
ncbi:RNA polymerase recycling motor HelD [Bacillus sp. 1P06AnD]|uniref:RNA polymerase recycling motor HelD n=1 Tax=Bacillus sp. 1P06AnD TaxID=3132208 RepID=UPI0039A023CC